MASIVVAGDTSGAITLAAPAVAGTNTLSLPANTGTIITTASTFAGTGPAFRAKPSTNQSVTSGVYTKVTLGTEDWDTNNNFASSRFTPTVAGYYFISGALYATFAGSATYVWALIYKNGVSEISGNLNVPVQTVDGVGIVNGLVYLNGSTDYVELYCYLAGTSPSVSTTANTQFSGFLARTA